MWSSKKKPLKMKVFSISEPVIEMTLIPEPPSVGTEMKAAPPPIAHSSDMIASRIRPFEQALCEFIAKHVLMHYQPTQRHFIHIKKLFSSDKTPGEKLIEITATLQLAVEYPFSKAKKRWGFIRSQHTQVSYDRLYRKLYLEFSEAFADGESLLRKVKTFLGREPDAFFMIERIPSRMPIAAAAPSTEDSLVEIPLSVSKDFSLAEAALYTLVARFFLEEGNLDANTFRLIRNRLRKPLYETNALSPKNIQDTQVYLYSGIYYEIGNFRSEKTEAFYQNLQCVLFREAYSKERIEIEHHPYRAALLEERAKAAEAAASAAAYCF